MKNIKLCIRYDGTNYYGWQRQPDKITVGGILEDKLQELIKQPVKIISASRTDAGAHAYGQVVNFKANISWDVKVLPKAINARLPQDIVVYDACYVPMNFHARFSAKWRRYQYLILNSEFPSPFYRNYTYFYPHPLDISRMISATKFLLGKHDFTAFAIEADTIQNPIRTVKLLLVEKRDKFISIDIIADAFLYGMIRSIVGLLIDIGCGRREIDDVKYIIQSKDRSKGSWVAPACGLYLVEVGY
jgi:tRNA pseudouridine38-40 synthase